MEGTNYSRYEDRITSKIILVAKLTNITPLLIGRGSGDSVDIEVMKTPDEKPFIPGSSIAGCLKSFIEGGGGYFWGTPSKKRSKDDPLQSHIRFDDLVPATYSKGDFAMRDGVKINHKTGTAEENKKYDYEIVEPEMVFPFRAEITLRNSMRENHGVRTLVSQIKNALESPHFRMGAHTNTGFGKFSCSDFKAYQFNFPKDANHWFDYLKNNDFSIPVMELEEVTLPKAIVDFSIQANFRLKTSLLIGAYGIDGKDPDKSQLKSRNRFVLPGKSIRGAIRHRAEKICRILGWNNQLMSDLFGYVSEDDKTQIRGRLRVEEYIFQDNEVEAMLQNRNRIDRFTGGAIKNALFNSEPVWTTGNEKIQLTFSILKDSKPEEMKLLLLLLKDLWLEDLAIGGEKNIGRGVMTGLNASIHSKGECIATFTRGENRETLIFSKGSPELLNNLP